MNKEMKRILDKVKNLEDTDLEFYKKLISFFDFIGLSIEDLVSLVTIVKSFPELVHKINLMLEDQKFINEKYMESKKDEHTEQNPLTQFNKERQHLNPYG